MPLSNERIEKVKAYVTSYQVALRTLVAQLPDDGYVLPLSIAAAIGGCEIWPCIDAAVVLTYVSGASEVEVIVRDQVEKNVEQFMKDGEPFAYVDEMGEPGPVRLSFTPQKEPSDPRIASNDFLFSSFSFDDLISWGGQKEPQTLDLGLAFFVPRFKRITVFGWNASLGPASARALKDFRKAYVLKNLSDLITEESRKLGTSEAIFQAADQRVREFEALLGQEQSDESVSRFLLGHPELIRPDYLRAYRDIAIKGGVIHLVLLVPGETGPEYVAVKLGGANNVFFTESNEPSEALALAESQLLAYETSLGEDPKKVIGGTLGAGKINFYSVMGRNVKLNYQQKKQLREKDSASNSHFATYEDLINRFRFEVNDVTEIRDRYLPVDTRLESLNITSEDAFSSVMQEIDREMQDENIPLTARSMEAWLRFSSVFGLSLMGSDPLSKKIYDWYDRWYGDRAKVNMSIGSMGVILRGDILRMEFPRGYGVNRVVCSRELTKERPLVIFGTREKPPTLNVMDFIEGLTQEYASTLTDEEVEGLFNQFVFGHTAFMRIDEASERSELTKQARADLIASTDHLFASPTNHALSKWSSLQAAEKFIKAFIGAQGVSPPRHHRLRELASIAESHGLLKMPEIWLDDIQCSAEVRYGGISVTAQDAVEAQYAALQVCEHITNQL